MTSFLSGILGGKSGQKEANTNPAPEVGQEQVQKSPEIVKDESGKEINVVAEAMKNGYPELSRRISQVMKEGKEKGLTYNDLAFLSAYSIELTRQMNLLADPERSDELTKDQIDKLGEIAGKTIDYGNFFMRYLKIPPQPSGNLLFNKEGSIRTPNELGEIYNLELKMMGLNTEDSELKAHLESASEDQRLKKELVGAGK